MDIDVRTQFCGVIGNPIDHSLSPAIHNAAFRELELNFVYLAWQVTSIGEAIKGLRALGNFRGASVTIPHKVAAIPFLDEVDAMARQIGAINTIVLRDGKLTGSNTDALGALRALQEGKAPLHDEAVVLLGSGGAARAIAFALASQAKIRELHLLGIEEQERKKLASDLSIKTGVSIVEGHLDEEKLKAVLPRARVLIHCTPVGMVPNVNTSCVPAQHLHAGLTVMDIVYNPRQTRLLTEAKAIGCRTIAGLEMFLFQAAAQFEQWTGRSAPLDVMRRVLESHFS